ncbi:MAG: glutamate-1-semialdehyde 2,1-aminomutase [Syntrophaceticus sp.]
MIQTNNSKLLFKKACQYMPGGVNSPVRAFKAVGGDPIFFSRGRGSHIYDVDGNEYIDYVCSWGPLILGHLHPDIVTSLRVVLEEGTSFGAPTEREITLTSLIVNALPSVEKVRLVNSGTEATMSAVRVARAFTGRKKIIKFAGCYHGHADGFLVQAGSGALTLGVPSSPGVPEEIGSLTMVLPYNDVSAVRRAFQKDGDKIAAVIVEPVAANMGVVPPQPGFLETLREVTAKASSLLIFDEVITGFRLAYNGAQGFFGIEPDLTCLGKIIGGGLPVGAYGGRKEIMDVVAPEGPVYQAGTLSGNPLAVQAGITTLEYLAAGEQSLYKELEEKAIYLERGLLEAAQDAGVPLQVNRVGSLLSLFFTNSSVTNLEETLSADQELYKTFFAKMLAEGIYLPPSQFEALFLSTAHSEDDIKRTINAAGKIFSEQFKG